MTVEKGKRAMDITKIGLIGYGEVGQSLAEGLLANKQLSVQVFDIRFNTDKTPDSLAANAKARGLILRNDIDTLVKNSELVISAVTCEQALQVAEQASESLASGKIFVDMNTVAPRQKIKIGELVENSGGIFIEIAILGLIASHSYKSPMLACGKKARDFADYLNNIGFEVSFLSEEVGQASSMKMFRSVFAKGVEGLLLEMLVAAERCNMLEPVMNMVTAHMDRSSFLEIAEAWITTSLAHARRRAEEMDHVIETIENLKMHPLMATATKERLRKGSELNVKDLFKGEKPKDYRKIIKAMAKSNYS
jgi:3-hydroxyisobutyrate dehydrogenase-like beta-hydroxyacid dehydrogenase